MKPALCLQSTLFTELAHNKYLAVIILVSGSCWNIDFEVRTCALTETLATTQLQSRVASAPRERENRIMCAVRNPIVSRVQIPDTRFHAGSSAARNRASAESR